MANITRLTAPVYTVKKSPNSNFFVAYVDGPKKGVRVSPFFARSDQALSAARRLNAAIKLRHYCLCCGQEFPSDGAHNRLCNSCQPKGLDRLTTEPQLVDR